MRKLSSKHLTIKFNVDSDNRLEITSNGIIVSDEIAEFVYKRLGDANVTVEKIDIDEAIKNVLGEGESSKINSNNA